jgi:hypothetical protein
MPLKRLLYISLTYYFLSINYSASAQETLPLVSGEFKNISVEQFLLQLEKQTGYHFYFDISQLDSITIDISVNKQALPEVLKLAFANTSIGFAHDTQNNIFISKGQVVHTELPNGFFGKDKKSRN